MLPDVVFGRDRKAIDHLDKVFGSHSGPYNFRQAQEFIIDLLYF
jgi:hypothetical protein